MHRFLHLNLTNEQIRISVEIINLGNLIDIALNEPHKKLKNVLFMFRKRKIKFNGIHVASLAKVKSY